MRNFNKQLRIVLAFSAIMGLNSGKMFAQLVKNGGFEESSIGVVANTDVKGWLIQTVTSIAKQPVFEIESDVVKSGNQAIKVAVNGIGTNQWDIQLISDSIPVKSGATYTYSVWAKANKAGAQVNFTVGNYDYKEYKVIRPANLTTEWQQFNMQFTVTDNVTFIRAPIHLNYATDTGKIIYIDGLRIVDDNFGKAPVIVEAESGVVGSSFSVLKDGNITYVTTKTNYTGYKVNDITKMITYSVTFPDSGNYNLFARMKVGTAGANDDSYISANGFGEKDTIDADWVMVNQLSGAGFSDSTDVVDDIGTGGSSVWKWVNISKNFYPSTANKFSVSMDNLTKTFQIGSREDGLSIDKFAFAKSSLYYTVGDLDHLLPGSPTKVKFDSSNFYQGPPFAKGKEKFLGCAYGDLPDNIFANYWNQMTPGNAGKWGSVAASQDSTKWDWAGLDRAYNYAKAHNIIFKEHTLIWGQQQPSWISSLDATTQLNYIETWIRQVGKRYPDLAMVDVVNEGLPSHNPPDGNNNHAKYKDALGGNGTTGYDWVIKAFELARKYIPNAKLLLNDYGIINDDGATTNYLVIINLLKDRGLIDGIGVQGHRFEFESVSTTTLKYNLDRLYATGLPVYITEFDLGNISDAGTPDDNVQLQLYKKIFPTLWLHPGVKGITLWGYLKGQMWQTTCFIVNADGTNRPALDWLENYVDTVQFTGIAKTINNSPSSISLEQNYPNPFSSVTNIKFNINKPAMVSLKVYDMLGKEVITLVNENLNTGAYTMTWNVKNSSGSNLGNGTYYCRLVADSEVINVKMILIK
jgi:endo-1,4-beta-xylanase